MTNPRYVPAGKVKPPTTQTASSQKTVTLNTLAFELFEIRKRLDRQSNIRAKVGAFYMIAGMALIAGTMILSAIATLNNQTGVPVGADFLVALAILCFILGRAHRIEA